MLPILLDLNFVRIYTNGVFLLLAFFWGSFLLWKNFLLTANKEETIFDGLFISLAGGLLVGRLLHVILNFEDFGFSILKFILINGYPGISLYGLLIGAFFSLRFYFKSRKIDVIESFDYVIPAVFLSLGLGKLGSFLSGSEIGSKTNFFASVRYPGFEGARHLTSFYESILFLVFSFVAYKILFAIRRGKYEKGTNHYFFWFIFSLIYLIFDFFKSNKALIFGYSFNLFISLVILLTIALISIYHFRSFIKKYGKKIFKGFYKKEKRKTS